MRAPPNPFWRFSLRIYRAPGVQAACMALQERCGADVNLLLFCGWTGRAGRALDASQLLSTMEHVERWQTEVIAPMRLARRALKQQAAGGPAAALATPLRARVAALELDLERVEQTLLAEMASTWAAPAQRTPAWPAVAANLACYLELLCESAGPAEVEHVALIAGACSPARLPLSHGRLWA
jgi:uncharacterized protein (TIGR02444 family)